MRLRRLLRVVLGGAAMVGVWAAVAMSAGAVGVRPAVAEPLSLVLLGSAFVGTAQTLKRLKAF
jgi:hypothetical protein